MKKRKKGKKKEKKRKINDKARALDGSFAENSRNRELCESSEENEEGKDIVALFGAASGDARVRSIMRLSM